MTLHEGKLQGYKSYERMTLHEGKSQGQFVEKTRNIAHKFSGKWIRN